VLSGRSLCDELIARPDRLCCVVVCDLETSGMRRPCPTGGCRVKKKINKLCLYEHFLPETQCGRAQSFFHFISQADKKITPVLYCSTPNDSPLFLTSVANQSSSCITSQESQIRSQAVLCRTSQEAATLTFRDPLQLDDKPAAVQIPRNIKAPQDGINE
jgi:hypothetical protein